MFSMHLMIADMFGYIPSKPIMIFSGGNDFMRVPYNKITEIIILFAHLYSLL